MSVEQTNAKPLFHYLPQVVTYLKKQQPLLQEFGIGKDFRVSPLACGEYNLNFLIQGQQRHVFRINMASQIGRKDQIIYEYNALKLLQESGVTPIPYFVDDSRAHIDRGISIMEFLPGRPLEYKKDSHRAAKLFAKIHGTHIPQENNHLIAETQPLSLIYNECEGLLAKYFASPLADPKIVKYLQIVLEWMKENKSRESFFQDNPWMCMVNTEVNSSNFIIDSNKAFLVDWEMPRWGDPSTDLCHFLSPLTTLWKTDFRFNEKEKKKFLKVYRQALSAPILAESLQERMTIKMPYILLRGISWSAMAHIGYQDGSLSICHEDTWKTLCNYMNLEFIQNIFAPFINTSRP